MSSSIAEIRAGLEGRKQIVSGFKERASSLAAAREAKIREVATKEQIQRQALAELKELGVVPADLEPATLTKLTLTVDSDLEVHLRELEEVLVAAEKLVNGTTPSLD